MIGAIVLVIWQGAIDVAAGRMSGGTIAAFVLCGGLLAGAFGALSEVFGDLLRAAGASERLAELLDAEPDISAPAKPGAASRAGARRAGVRARDLSLSDAPRHIGAQRFQPHGSSRASALRWSARLARARRRSSSSPSASMIRRQGRVLLDGVDLRDADPADIRQRIAMVPQETVIFAASARDNLRYGNWDASEDQLWQAARDANAEDFLRALPEGLDTFMGEGGARLSGGQRQRIAIARALLRDAPLLLLDEATSALDAESERLVQDALDRLMEHRTTIVIAHRLATVRAADRIVVMDARPDRRGRHARERSMRAAASMRGWRASSSRIAPLRRSSRRLAAGAPPPRRTTARAPPVVPRLARTSGLRVALARAGSCAPFRPHQWHAASLALPSPRMLSRAQPWRGWTRLAVLRASRFAVSRVIALRATAAFAGGCRVMSDDAEPLSSCGSSPALHLPDITRCAASATASAMIEPSLVALDIMLLAACEAVSAASRPASRICAARLRAGADCRRCGGKTGSEHFLAHRGLGQLVHRVVVELDEDDFGRTFSSRILPSLYLPASRRKTL